MPNNLQMYRDLVELLNTKIAYWSKAYAMYLHPSWQIMMEQEFESLLAGTIEWRPMSSLEQYKAFNEIIWITDGLIVELTYKYWRTTKDERWLAWAELRKPPVPATLPVDFTTDDYKVKL